MLSVTKCFKFEAAHFLPGYKGDCKRIHGHSYKLEITVIRKHWEDYEVDMIIDFKELSNIVKVHIIYLWDHQLLNELPEFANDRPTAENMVTVIYDILHSKMPKEVELIEIKLWETEDSYAEWRKK